MESKYQTSAQAAQLVIDDVVVKVKEAADTASKVMIDRRFSEVGKEEAKREIFSELNAAMDHSMELLRDAANDFCNTYRVKLPEDQKDHSMDIANTLKVIEMMGFNLTADVLKTILEPIKNSYKNMKMISDIIMAKNENGGKVGIGYTAEVIETLSEYMGVNTSVFDYLERFKDIEEVVTNKNLKIRFHVISYPNETVVQLSPDIPYIVFTLPDSMIATGEMYATLEGEFSDLFKAHIPTDAEMIMNALQ